MTVKKIFNKENLKPVIVLSVICIVIAATLAVVNMISAPVIEAEAQRKINESLSSVMPGGDFEQLDISIMDGVPETVTAIYKDRISGGHVVTLEKQGYADKIYMTAGIDDDGKVFITAVNGENAKRALMIVETIANDPEIGAIYRGKVTRLMTFGAFVEIAPGKEGLVHISKLDVKRTEKVEDAVSVGDEVIVKVVEIDDQGRINLSRRDALVEIEGAVVEDDGNDEDRKPRQRKDRHGFRK